MKIPTESQRTAWNNANDGRWLRKEFRRPLLALSSGIVWIFIALNSAYAQSTPMPMAIEDALKRRSFAPIGEAPIGITRDGSWITYVIASSEKMPSLNREAVIRTGVPFGMKGDDVWISNTRTHEVKNITGGHSENWSPAWSPDGSKLAFLSDRDGSGQAKLWIWERSGDSLRKVSDVAVRTDQLQWSPDGRNIYLTALPQGLSAGAYVEKLQVEPRNATTSRSIREETSVVLYRSAKISPEGNELPTSDPWNLDWMLRDLVSIDVLSGKVRYLVHGQRISAFLISADGLYVAYSSPQRFEKPGSQQTLYDLNVVTTADGYIRHLAQQIRLGPHGAEFSWSPDSKFVSFHTSGMEERRRDCYVIPRSGGTPRKITDFRTEGAPPRRISSVPLWDTRSNVYLVQEGALWRSPVETGKTEKLAEIPGHSITMMISKGENQLWTTGAGQFAIALVHDETGKQDGFYRIDLISGKSESLLEQGQCYTCASSVVPWVVSQDGNSFAFTAEDAQHDSDLWLTDAAFRQPRRLTNLNPQNERYEMGRVQLVNWLSDDGMRLSGALLLPGGYQPGKRYPLVIWVYGGDRLSDHSDQFGLVAPGPFNMQLLATRGYAVLLPDSPQQVGTPMLDLAKTVLPGVNKVIEMGVADPDRLAIMGQSNGGYSTLGLLVQTKRFKTAIDICGMGNLVSHYGEMDDAGATYGIPLEHGQNALGGSPWEMRDRYIENSPFFYLDRVETPLLIVHGTEDTAVAAYESDEVFVGLRRLGKEVEYAKYKGEAHTQLAWSYANQVDVCTRILKWLEDHLKRED